jgi:hypothetical protein
LTESRRSRAATINAGAVSISRSSGVQEIRSYLVMNPIGFSWSPLDLLRKRIAAGKILGFGGWMSGVNWELGVVKLGVDA